MPAQRIEYRAPCPTCGRDADWTTVDLNPVYGKKFDETTRYLIDCAFCDEE